jgi:hypothetical protein
MDVKLFKTIGSWVVAIIISGLCVAFFLKVLHFALEVIFSGAFIITILIIALPIYVIVRKKLFK